MLDGERPVSHLSFHPQTNNLRTRSAPFHCAWWNNGGSDTETAVTTAANEMFSEVAPGHKETSASTYHTITSGAKGGVGFLPVEFCVSASSGHQIGKRRIV